MDPAKKITQARVAMQLYHPFFGYLAISLIPKEKPEMIPPTMATDGTYLFYHPDFVNDTPLKHLMGVISHEVGHIVLQHLARRQTREPVRWNFAADYAVNYIVLKEFELPAGCLVDQQYNDKSCEYIYNQLPVEGRGMMTLDSHEEWADWGKGDEGKGDGKDGDGKADQAIGGEKVDDMTQRWRELVAQAATQARMRGKMPGHLEGIVGDILQPKLNWKAILTDMITSCVKSNYCLYPWNKKHLWRGFYLPGMTGTEISIAVVIDSSGSISNDEITEFLSEIHAICESYDSYTIWLYVCDAVIHQRFELHSGDPLPKTVQGRGGTDFRDPLKEAESLPITSLVYMTDLYGTFPEREPLYPVIWMCTTDAEAPWGFVIRYPSADKRR